jgi:hypothetical protein
MGPIHHPTTQAGVTDAAPPSSLPGAELWLQPTNAAVTATQMPDGFRIDRRILAERVNWHLGKGRGNGGSEGDDALRSGFSERERGAFHAAELHSREAHEYDVEHHPGNGGVISVLTEIIAKQGRMADARKVVTEFEQLYPDQKDRFVVLPWFSAKP